MSSAIYYRLIGQAVTLAVHGGNSLAMFLNMQNEDLMKDPEIKNMTSMQGRYLTVWNIGFQMAYFSLAFTSDILTVIGRDNMIPKSLRQFRQVFFTSIVWPVAWFILIIFWPFFLTNRELLFPAFIDKIFSIKSNLVMHFFIAPAVLWELMFLPRHIPKSHGKYMRVTTTLYFVYVSFIIFTYFQHGIWPYPIFNVIYGTIYFPIFFAVAFLLMVTCYHIQWKLTAVLWGNDKINKIK